MPENLYPHHLLPSACHSTNVILSVFIMYGQPIVSHSIRQQQHDNATILSNKKLDQHVYTRLTFIKPSRPQTTLMEHENQFQSSAGTGQRRRWAGGSGSVSTPTPRSLVCSEQTTLTACRYFCQTSTERRGGFRCQLTRQHFSSMLVISSR